MAMAPCGNARAWHTLQDIAHVPAMHSGHFLLSSRCVCACVCVCVCVCVCHARVCVSTQVDVPRLLRWLHHVQWKGHVKSRTLTIRVDCPYEYTDEQAHVLLLTQLSILRAVRLCKEDMPTVHLVLEGWPLTSEVMSALQGLPQWPCALHIKDSQWPLEPDAYRTLAQYIPTR